MQALIKIMKDGSTANIFFCFITY